MWILPSLVEVHDSILPDYQLYYIKLCYWKRVDLVWGVCILLPLCTPNVFVKAHIFLHMPFRLMDPLTECVDSLYSLQREYSPAGTVLLNTNSTGVLVLV